MCPRPPGLGHQARANLVINQASDSTDSSGVVTAVVSISLGDTLITAGTVQGILNNNAAARESGVVSHIIGRAVLAARFFARGVGAWVQVMDTLVATIADSAHAVWQAH